MEISYFPFFQSLPSVFNTTNIDRKIYLFINPIGNIWNNGYWIFLRAKKRKENCR